MQKCTKCNIEKPLSEFGTDTAKVNFKVAGSNKKVTQCKQCKAMTARLWREKNPKWRERITNKITKYPEEDRYLLSAIRTKLSQAKQNNKRNNLPFNITADYLYNLFKKQDKKCAISGLKMNITKRDPYMLSIDKIIPSKGYVEGNVQWTCWAVNRAKGDMSLDELLTICKAIVEMCNDYQNPTAVEEVEYSSSELEVVSSSKEDDDIV
jgi:hypothetical protein